MSSQEEKSNIYNHLILLLDESGSMESMGSEPKQSVLEFVKNFKKENNESRLTFATFNDKLSTHLDNSSIEEGQLDFHYNPTGCTALFDAITTTINNTLESKEPNTKIMVIITDGQENSSSKYRNKKELKKLVTKVETENEWKVIFLGVNIDGFSDAHDININLNRISEFDQTHKGSLLELCRTASDAANTFTRSRTNGDTQADLILPSPPPRLRKTHNPDPESNDLPPLVFSPLRREFTSNY